MSTTKAFLVGTLKIGFGILVAVVGLAILGWGAYGVWQAREAREKAPLAEPKVWPEIRIEALGDVRLSLSTMWRDDWLHYQFSVVGYPLTIDAALKGSAQRPETSSTFTITFLDRHGFKVCDHSIPLHKMIRVIDAKGGTTGLTANDSTYLAAESYSRASVWNVTWNF